MKNEQAAILVRAIILNASVGVERLYIYKWLEERGMTGVDLFGLISADTPSTPKAAIPALNAFMEFFDDTNFKKKLNLNNKNIYGYRFLNKKGERIDAIWAVVDGLQIAIPEDSDIRIIDMYGNRIVLEKKDIN